MREQVTNTKSQKNWKATLAAKRGCEDRTLEYMSAVFSVGNEATREQMKWEAIKRLMLMEEMGLNEAVFETFANTDHEEVCGLYYSNQSTNRQFHDSDGLYHLEESKKADELKGIIERVEEETGGLAYLAMHGTYVDDYLNEFEMLDVFLVSPLVDMWQTERVGLAYGRAVCWTENMTDSCMSSLRYVSYRVTAAGGLMNTSFIPCIDYDEDE